MKSFRLLFPLTIVFALAAGCSGNISLDERCQKLKGIGLSSESYRLINAWVITVISDPKTLSATGRENGKLLASDYQLGLDWNAVGIPESSGVVQLYGKDVDYRDITRGSVEAVAIGYGFGYQLVFKIDSKADIERFVMEDANRANGGVILEELSSGITLVCQQPR